jgi:hypothetical protein
MVIVSMVAAMDTSSDPGPDLAKVQSTITTHRRNMTAEGRFGFIHDRRREGENPVEIARDALAHDGLNPHQWAIQVRDPTTMPSIDVPTVVPPPHITE